MAFVYLLATSILVTCAKGAEIQDPGLELGRCVDGGEDVDTCTEKVVEDMRSVMETGIPELNLPKLDPLNIDEIDFDFNAALIKFTNLDIRGLKDFTLKETHVDKDQKTWDVELYVPDIRIKGQYEMSGNVAVLNLDGQHGDETFNATEVTISGTGFLADSNGKIRVNNFDLKAKFDNIKIALDCLFRKEETGECCEGNWGNSCQPVFAKTIHKFINKDGKKFAETFQPEISKSIGAIIKDFFNIALKNLDSSYMIN